MKLRTFAIATILLGFVNFANAAETGHYSNDCQAYADSWVIDPLTGERVEMPDMAVTINHPQTGAEVVASHFESYAVTAHGSSFLWNSIISVSLVIEEDFSGTLELVTHRYADSNRYPEFPHIDNMVRTVKKSGTWTAGSHIDMVIGACYYGCTSRVWDGSPGPYESVTFDTYFVNAPAGVRRTNVIIIKDSAPYYADPCAN